MHPTDQIQDLKEDLRNLHTQYQLLQQQLVDSSPSISKKRDLSHIQPQAPYFASPSSTSNSSSSQFNNQNYSTEIQQTEIQPSPKKNKPDSSLPPTLLQPVNRTTRQVPAKTACEKCGSIYITFYEKTSHTYFVKCKKCNHSFVKSIQ